MDRKKTKGDEQGKYEQLKGKTKPPLGGPDMRRPRTLFGLRGSPLRDFNVVCLDPFGGQYFKPFIL
jgi:hypothetical protein